MLASALETLRKREKHVMSFGDRVRRRRLSARLRQRDFFESGLTQSQLSMIENTQIQASPENVDRIADALHLAALDLVAGTELEAAYIAARFNVEEKAVILQATQFSRSQRLVAVQESYRRIMQFFRIMRFGSAPHAISIEDETLFQQSVRIFRRVLDAAREYDGTLADAMFVPRSLIEEPEIEMSRLRVLMQRSLAFVASMVLEYPEADDDAERQRIAVQIGLGRLDLHLARSVSEALDIRIA
jgi:transcriptional regulator with XRE-family HTH domain